MKQQITFNVIGIVHSCYKEKYGIPRQPGLVEAETAKLELLPPYDRPETVKGLEGFSHIWVSFIFHGVEAGKWSPTVRPPRLGGNERVGVFASRSTHRPNPIGLSVVPLSRIEINNNKAVIYLAGADLLDGTPVIDIKPYIPYVDSVPKADAGFAVGAPEARLSVRFNENSERVLHQQQGRYPALRQVIIESLRYDPRPAYKQNKDSEGGMRLFDFDVKYKIEGEVLEVKEIVSV